MNQIVKTSLTRRQFVVASATAAGGLAICVAFPALADAASIGPQAWGPDSAPNEVNAFLAIEPDGSILIRSPHQEMGQGAITALPMIVAEELECDWSKVKVEYASPARNLREKQVYGPMTTVGSRGVRTSWQMLLQAGASARERLVQAAAQRWNVPAGECEAANSKVLHKASGRSLDYGALAAEAGKIKLDKEPAIRTPEQFKFIGKSVPRLDTPLKINGSAKFAIDTQIPGMVYAAISACPVFGGKLKSVDDAPAKGRRGVLGVVKLDDAVAVVADRYWRAKEALALLKPEWDTGEAGKTDSAQFTKLYRDTLDGPMVSARNDGNVDGEFAKGGKIVEAIYEAPHLAHATMEPLNATVHLQGDKLDVWLGSQTPMGSIRQAAACVGPQARTDQHPQLFPRRRLRTPFHQRRNAAGDPGRQAGRQAGEAGVDARRRHDAGPLPAAGGGAPKDGAWAKRPADRVRGQDCGGLDPALDRHQQGGERGGGAGGRGLRQYPLCDPQPARRLHVEEHARAGDVLAFGRLLAECFLCRKLYRRTGAGGGAGRLQVQTYAARRQIRLPRRARQDRGEERLGQTAAGKAAAAASPSTNATARSSARSRR